MKVLATIFSFYTISTASAQFYSKDSIPSVIVHKDPRFDELASEQAGINKRAYMLATHYVRGFRIQAANTQNRDEANAVKAELLRRFPEEKSYLLYQAPNFRVRIGNFLTQKESGQLRKMISTLYPDKGIYIVPDIVEHKPTDEDKPGNIEK